jgi:TonB family protein
MNLQKLLCVSLMCFGSPLVYAAAQTQPAAAPPATAPTSPPSSATAAAAPLPDPKTPEEFFARARQLSDLEASGIPFHLKATYVASGDAEFTGNGTYEEWWQSKDFWRKEATLGDYKYVAIMINGVEKDYASSSYTPLRLRQAVEFSVVSIPVFTDGSPKWKLEHQTLNGIDLTVLSSQYQCPRATSPVQCVTKEVFTAEGLLRARVNNTMETLYNGFQSFHSLLIPHSVKVASHGVTLLTISIQNLDPLDANEPQLSKDAPVPTTMHPLAIPFGTKPGPNVKPSKLIHQVAPNYPPDLKLARVEGTVVVEASVDADGNVREPYLSTSTGNQLDDAAIDAIQQWKYEPLRIDGVP